MSCDRTFLPPERSNRVIIGPIQSLHCLLNLQTTQTASYVPTTGYLHIVFRVPSIYRDLRRAPQYWRRSRPLFSGGGFFFLEKKKKTSRAPLPLHGQVASRKYSLAERCNDRQFTRAAGLLVIHFIAVTLHL